jgi:LPXTG-motif cell wall-anchored protein
MRTQPKRVVGALERTVISETLGDRHMRVTTCMAGALLLVAAGVASGQTRTDRSFTAVSKSCEGIQWSQTTLARNPKIGSACQSVEERDGKTYVKFQGTVQRNDRGKELEIRVKNGDTITVNPPDNMVVWINDKKTPVRQLSRGDELNFYVPEDQFTAQFAQEQQPTPAQYVAVPIVYRETTYEPERTAANLPSTASNNMLVMLIGGVFAAFGMLLTVRRRNGSRF